MLGRRGPSFRSNDFCWRQKSNRLNGVPVWIYADDQPLFRPALSPRVVIEPAVRLQQLRQLAGGPTHHPRRSRLWLVWRTWVQCLIPCETTSVVAVVVVVGGQFVGDCFVPTDRTSLEQILRTARTARRVAGGAGSGWGGITTTCGNSSLNPAAELGWFIAKIRRNLVVGTTLRFSN